VVEVGHNRNAVEAAFPRLALTWVTTASSTDSVFAVSREDLVR
jgi:ribosomal protein L3 glutamine methyltransferase